jgi:acyl-ACP thioesterase
MLELMRAQSLVFALSKMFLRMEEPLRWGDRVVFTTWFAEEGSVAARRDWVVTCARTGRLLGAATSTWLCFNLETRRMARLPPSLRTWFDSAGQPSRHAFAELAESDRGVTEFGAPPPPRRSGEKLSEVTEDTPCLLSGRLRVRRCDLDFNSHANNTRYLEWVIDDVPDEVFRSRRLVEVHLEYRAECTFGEEVTSRVSLVRPDGSCLLPGEIVTEGGEPLSFRHSLLRTGDGAELLRARTVWEARA